MCFIKGGEDDDKYRKEFTSSRRPSTTELIPITFRFDFRHELLLKHFLVSDNMPGAAMFVNIMFWLF